MRAREGYRRTGTRGTWRPNERERRVLDLLVEGRTNPEIAAALGITVDGAKWHVGELMARTGLKDRHALARWWTVTRNGRQLPLTVPLLALRPFWPLLAAAVLVLAVLIRIFASGNDAGPAPSVDALSDFAGAPKSPAARQALGPPPPCDFSLPADFRSVSGDELIAEGMVRLDDTDIIESERCPLRVSNRADRSVAWLSDDGFIANGFMYLGEEWDFLVAELEEAGASGPMAEKIGSPVYRFGEDGIFLIVQALNHTSREVRRVAFDFGWAPVSRSEFDPGRRCH
jgi:DNA-binding CsgD family transcriptional regulator